MKNPPSRRQTAFVHRVLPFVACALLAAATSGCGMVERLDIMIGQMTYTNQQIALTNQQIAESNRKIAETNERMAELQKAAEATEKRLAPLEKLLKGLGAEEDQVQVPPPRRRP